MPTYINRNTGNVVDTELEMGKGWSKLVEVYENGEKKLRFELNGATVDLIEVKNGNTNAA